MPKVKIPRKSTAVDMTAMCDVAFLLLSFFILATKQKPPEALAVQPPNSVSTKVAKQDALLITLSKDGKAYLMLGDDTKKDKILEDINATQQLGLNATEMAALHKAEFIGVPLGGLKSYLNKDPKPSASQLSGIPLGDSTTNELTKWIRSITNAYAGEDQKKLEETLMIKADGEVKYPVYRAIKQSLTKNQIYKFKIVTNGESVPPGTELYEKEKANKAIN